MENNELKKNMDDELQRQIDRISNFWKDEYPYYSIEKKIGYWSGTINQQMRWQAESGLNEYAIFSPRWYKWAKEQEPEFDKIIDEVFKRFLAWEWDKNEYLKRINGD